MQRNFVSAYVTGLGPPVMGDACPSGARTTCILGAGCHALSTLKNLPNTSE